MQARNPIQGARRGSRRSWALAGWMGDPAAISSALAHRSGLALAHSTPATLAAPTHPDRSAPQLSRNLLTSTPSARKRLAMSSGAIVPATIRNFSSCAPPQASLLSTYRIGHARRGGKVEIKFVRCPPSYEPACSVWVRIGESVEWPVGIRRVKHQVWIGSRGTGVERSQRHARLAE